MKSKKKRVFFTIDENILKSFNDYIQKNLLSQSAVLSKLVEEFLKDKKIDF